MSDEMLKEPTQADKRRKKWQQEARLDHSELFSTGKTFLTLPLQNKLQQLKSKKNGPVSLDKLLAKTICLLAIYSITRRKRKFLFEIEIEINPGEKYLQYGCPLSEFDSKHLISYVAVFSRYLGENLYAYLMNWSQYLRDK